MAEITTCLHLYLYSSACSFLLITDEDNWRLPKRLEINFINGPVLSSNLSIRYEIIFHSNNIIVVRYSQLLHSCIRPTNR